MPAGTLVATAFDDDAAAAKTTPDPSLARHSTPFFTRSPTRVWTMFAMFLLVVGYLFRTTSSASAFTVIGPFAWRTSWTKYVGRDTSPTGLAVTLELPVITGVRTAGTFGSETPVWATASMSFSTFASS